MPAKIGIELINWSMYVTFDGYLVLKGIAGEHPRLGKNIELSHTSRVVSVSESEDHILVCETKNSIYICNWKYVNLVKSTKDDRFEPINCSKDILEKYSLYIKLMENIDSENIPSDLKVYYDLIANGKKELITRTREESERLLDTALKYNNCVYLEISRIMSGNILAYNILGEAGVINPVVHSGEFINTVAYETNKDSKVNVALKYFAGGDSIDICHITKNVKNIVLSNNKNIPIIINGKQLIRPNETIVIDADDVVEG